MAILQWPCCCCDIVYDGWSLVYDFSVFLFARCGELFSLSLGCIAIQLHLAVGAP